MKRLIAFVRRNERWVSSAVFLGGFVVDSATLTLARVDFVLVHAAFSFYLVAAALSIILTHHLAGAKPDSAATKRSLAFTLLPMATQFCLGALLSGCLVFYTKSAALYASWPFLLLLAVVFAGNEYLRKYRERAVFQAALFFFALYSYALFAIPVAAGRIGTAMFLASGLASVSAFAAFVLLLRVVRKDGFARLAAGSGLSAAGILAAVHLFYFAGILPPLPLALKDAGAYHAVVRVGEGYEVRAEEGDRWRLWTRQVLHLARGEEAYAYSAVFAPVALSAPIVHRWQRYDAAAGSWVTHARIPFFIRGGRDAGYRGFSKIAAWEAGQWRVVIETESGAVIGYLRFDIEAVPAAPELHAEMK